MPYRLNGIEVESGGPEDRLLPWDRVQDMAGISRTTAWRMQRIGAFPTPVPVSPGRVAWWESELNAWKASRSALRSLTPPTRPRLPGMARAAPILARSAASPPKDVVSAARSVTAEPVPQADPPARRRKVRTPNLDQFDFGF